ncbi:TIR domain-containing protein [Methanimicrococcus sp. OttesenSCG-928-J09]|nr:TIR domain-containing protein [Methanimicrococcus sp. OttesenSCG-928-J09]
MAYRNKTYVAFDGDNDIRSYNLMKAWKQNDNTEFNFYDAHDLNTARDSSSEETIKRKLRERMDNSKVFVLLIGENTKNLYRFVRWEIELALEKDLPIIAVNLNHSRSQDSRCPPILKNELAIYIPYKSAIMQHALENWPNSHIQYRKEGKTGWYYYTDSVYKSLGL